jgi:hypothetical protein
MIDPRWVTAHGKRILVETLETPDMKARKRKQEAFVMLPLHWAADMAKATGTAAAMVWILLSYTAWKENSPTFPLTNTTLAHFGIGREVKRRVLEKLEAAGRIKVKRRSTRAPIVTLLVTPKLSRRRTPPQ